MCRATAPCDAWPGCCVLFAFARVTLFLLKAASSIPNRADGLQTRKHSLPLLCTVKGGQAGLYLFLQTFNVTSRKVWKVCLAALPIAVTNAGFGGPHMAGSAVEGVTQAVLGVLLDMFYGLSVPRQVPPLAASKGELAAALVGLSEEPGSYCVPEGHRAPGLLCR